MKVNTVNLGDGKTGITCGLQLPNETELIGLLFLEPDKGAGIVAAPITDPERQRGVAVFPEEVGGTTLSFNNPMTIDVVIEQLATLRCDWNRAVNDPDFRRELWEKSEAAIAARNQHAEGGTT